MQLRRVPMQKRIVIVIAIVLGLLVLLRVIAFFFQAHKPNTPQNTEIRAERSAPNAKCPNTFMSWNLENFGTSKTDEAIERMAEILSVADIVAVQEVTAGKDHGIQAVAKLADALSRKGAKWDYIVSEPTMPPSPGVERYAYLWKTHRVSVNRREAHLVHELEEAIDREPYEVTFEISGSGAVQIFTIHTVPTAKHPINEIKVLTAAHELKSAQKAIVAGDLNLGPNDTDAYFEQAGFVGHIDALTSLGAKMHGERYFAKQYDNIYTKGVKVCSSGVVDFVKTYYSPPNNAKLHDAREVSDHAPVVMTFGFN